jgi:hypothetical protein
MIIVLISCLVGSTDLNGYITLAMDLIITWLVIFSFLPLAKTTDQLL